MTPAFEFQNVTRTYISRGGAEVHAVRDFSLKVEGGEFVALMGPSGCGKSTLLHLLGGLEPPTTGKIFVSGKELQTLSETALNQFRRSQIGIVFQFFNLLPTLTVLENVMMRLELLADSNDEAKQRATLLLEQVGLSHRLNNYPSTLSGGEMQRTAIARALVTNPLMLLADEPTGSLDSVSGKQIFELLKKLNSEHGVSIVLASHAAEVAQYASRVVRLRDGRLDS